MKKKSPRLFRCPDCAAEGLPDKPLSDFYFYKKRSTYCMRHHNQRNSACQVERLDPESPTYDRDFHERRKEAKRAWAQRKLNPTSPEYDAVFHQRVLNARARRRRRRA